MKSECSLLENPLLIWEKGLYVLFLLSNDWMRSTYLQRAVCLFKVYQLKCLSASETPFNLTHKTNHHICSYKYKYQMLMISLALGYPLQYSWTSLVAQLVKNPPTMHETLVQFLGRKIPWRRDRLPIPIFMGFSGGSDGKESACSVGDLGLIPGLGRSPGERHDNQLQHSCLENPHGQRSLVGYSPWGRKESLIRLSD